MYNLHQSTQVVSGALVGSMHEPTTLLKMPRILLIDGFRGFLALWILASQITRLSFDVAIDATYLVSAFLITSKLAVQVQDVLKTKPTYQAVLCSIGYFFARRAARIVPTLAVTACILTWFTDKLKFKTFEIPTEYNFSILKMITLIDCYSHIWPVLVLCFYYLILPFSTFAILAAPRSRLILYSLFIAPLIFDLGRARSFRDGPVYHFWTFMAGSAAGALFTSQQGSKVKITPLRKIALDCISGICLLWISYMAFSPQSYPQPLALNNTGAMFPFISTPLALMILKESLIKGPIGEFFETNLLVAVGIISYPLYMIQPLVKGYFTESNDSSAFSVVLSSIIAALFIHYTIEKPHNLLTSEWTDDGDREIKVNKIEPFKRDSKLV